MINCECDSENQKEMQREFRRETQGSVNHEVADQKGNGMMDEVDRQTRRSHIFGLIVFEIAELLKKSDQKTDHQPTRSAFGENVKDSSPVSRITD